jgi:hypothetical protein
MFVNNGMKGLFLLFLLQGGTSTFFTIVICYYKAIWGFISYNFSLEEK